MWKYFAIIYLSIVIECRAFNLAGSTNFAIGLEKLTSAVVVNNFTYYGTNTAPGYVIEFNLITNTMTRYLQLLPGEDYLTSATNYGNSVYFGTATSPGKVIQINTTTFTRVQSLTTTDNNLVSAFTLNSNVYFISQSNLYKIDVASFTILNTLNLLLGSGKALSSALLFNTIFIGTTSNIIYADANAMTLSGTLPTYANETDFTISIHWPGSAYWGIFVAQNLNRFMKVNLVGKTIDGRMDLGTRVTTAAPYGLNIYLGGELSLCVDAWNWKYLGNFSIGYEPAVSYTFNNNIYYGMNTSPAQVLCVNNTNSGYCANVILDSNDNYFTTSIEYNGNGYFVTASSFSNSILKVDLTSLTKSGSLVLNLTENNFFTSFVYKNHGYFGSKNGILLKIELDSFQKEASYVLGDSIQCAVVNDSIAYIGVGNSLLQIELSNLTVNQNISFASQVQQVAIFGSHVYVAGPYFLSQIDLVNFTIVKNVSISASSVNFLLISDNIAFICSNSTISKIDLTTQKNTSFSGYTAISGTIYGNYLYLGTSSNYVIQVEISTMQLVNRVDVGFNNQMTFIVQNSSIYFGGYSATGSIAKVSMDPIPVTSVTTATAADTTTTGSTSGDEAGIVSKKNKSNAGMIAGIVVGVSAFFGIVAVIILLILKRRKNKQNTNEYFPRNNSVGLDRMPSLLHIPMLSEVTILGELGKGNFGQVYKGTWKGSTVALKILRSSSTDEYKAFIKECELLRQLSHPNIVQFMGVFKKNDSEIYLVTEFMTQGDLLTLIRNKPSPLDNYTLKDMARQAAAGMSYLHFKKLIHRDLALRNLLVSMNENRYTIKVADFGMSSYIGESDNYYQQKPGANIPMKWTAPEAIKFGKITMSSDVWSFGICCWELYTKGEVPYAVFNDPQEMLDKIVQGYRLPQPKNCPNEIYTIMKACWHEDPNQRPSFDSIVGMLEEKKKVEEPPPQKVDMTPNHRVYYNMQ